MSLSTSRTGNLTLGHVLMAAGIEASEVVAIRHTYTSDGLRSAADLNPDSLLQYTRRQDVNNKLEPNPPRTWLTFMADGGLRSRFLAAYENRGEVDAEREATLRYFDLGECDLLSSLKDRRSWTGQEMP